MRVITGIARGRKLNAPTDNSIRPTSDMLKEAIFNIIQYDIEGRSVLDLFAGTGQLGIEALSRGARNAVFIDENPKAVKLIRDNLAKTKLSAATVIQAHALTFLDSSANFDLIFLDPPYSSDLLLSSLLKIIQFDKLNVGGIIICETPLTFALPVPDMPYNLLKSYKYGKVKISLFTRLFVNL